MGTHGDAEPVKAARVGRCGGDLAHDEVVRALLADAQDLLDQVFSRGEVVVEAAGLHLCRYSDVRETRANIAVLAEDLGCGVEDALSRRRGLLARAGTHRCHRRSSLADGPPPWPMARF